MKQTRRQKILMMADERHFSKSLYCLFKGSLLNDSGNNNYDNDKNGKRKNQKW